MLICPPLTNAVFPTTTDDSGFDGRSGQHRPPIRVRMAWGGGTALEVLPPGVVPGPGRSNHHHHHHRVGVERPRPVPSPETPATRHRPAKVCWTYTASQKKQDTRFFITILANMNRFSKFFYCHIRKKILYIFYHKDISNTLIMLPRYRGKRLTIVRSHQRGQTQRNSWMEA